MLLISRTTLKNIRKTPFLKIDQTIHQISFRIAKTDKS